MATLTDAKEIADTIAKTTQPVSIIAFGSVAKNGTGNDIVFIDSIYRGRYPGEEGILPLKEPGKKDAERSVLVADNLLRNCP